MGLPGLRTQSLAQRGHGAGVGGQSVGDESARRTERADPEASQGCPECSTEHGLAHASEEPFRAGKESRLFAVQTSFQKENTATASTSKTCREVRVPKRAVSQCYPPLIFIPFWYLVHFPRMQVSNLLAGDRINSVQFVTDRFN